MSIGRIRILIFAITTILLVGYTVALSWRAMYWSQRGWAGFAYSPHMSKAEEEKLASFSLWVTFESRSVIVVGAGSPAESAGIRIGDRVVSVNGIPVRDIAALSKLAARMKRGDEVVYKLQRGDREVDVRLQLRSPFEMLQTLLSLVTSIVVGLIYFAISTLVFWAKRGDRRAFLFYLLCSVGAGFFLVTAATEVEVQSFRGILPSQSIEAASVVLIIVYVALALLLSNLLLHFSLIFPKERPVVHRHPRSITWIHTLPFAMMAISFGSAMSVKGSAIYAVPIVITSAVLIGLTSFLFRRHFQSVGASAALLDHPWLTYALSGGVAVLLMQLTRISVNKALIAGVLVSVLWSLGFAALLLGYSVLSCVSLYASYRESGVEEKRQIRWPLWGLIVGVGGSGLVALVYTIIAATNIDLLRSEPAVGAVGQVLMKGCYVLIPIAFAFGILKYRLMEIDVVIRKTVTYTIVSGVVVALYLLLVAGVGSVVVGYSGIRSQSVTIVSTLAVAALFIPLRNFVQKIVERRFFRVRFDHEQALRRISNDLPKCEQTSLATQLAADRIQQTLQLRSVAIFLAQSDGSLAMSSKVGLKDESLAITFSGSDIDEALLSDSLSSTDPALSNEQRALLQKLRANVIVPVRSGRQLVGLITTGRKLSDEEITAEDLQFIGAVAERLSLSCEGLRLRAEEDEFRQAKAIQQTLLPATIPQVGPFEIVGTWRPARTVGGDYYDVIRLDDSTLAVCIGDVVGKGMPAALLMSSLQATVRAVAAKGVPPREVCERVRKVVSQNLSGGKFITFFYAVLDAGSMTLSYCDAGHNAPVLLRADGSIERLSTGGAVLGRLFGSIPYEDATVQLESGAVIVMFTDGVTEAQNDDGDTFGEERLESIVAAAKGGTAIDVQKRILCELESFSSAADDVAIVVARVS